MEEIRPWQYFRAICQGVFPSESCTSTSAFAANNASTAVAFPSVLAWTSAVLPFLSTASWLARYWRSMATNGLRCSLPSSSQYSIREAHMSNVWPPFGSTTSSGFARCASNCCAHCGQFREHAAASADMPPLLLRPGSALRRSSSAETSLKPTEQAHCRSEQPLYAGSRQLGSKPGYLRRTSSGARCICSNVGPPWLRIIASASSFFP
mmetsp:Transcript_77193/g.213429  ORF Transcript_77193/g.213429 Transcript_77193/m.213429 type:complete len:208 (-) Transcript_77193:622-1245(-)